MLEGTSSIQNTSASLESQQSHSTWWVRLLSNVWNIQSLSPMRVSFLINQIRSSFFSLLRAGRFQTSVTFFLLRVSWNSIRMFHLRSFEREVIPKFGVVWQLLPERTDTAKNCCLCALCAFSELPFARAVPLFPDLHPNEGPSFAGGSMHFAQKTLLLFVVSARLLLGFSGSLLSFLHLRVFSFPPNCI